MGTTSLKESIINALKSDNLDKIKIIDSRRPFVKDEEISKNRTAIVLCSYFDAKNCLAYFISKGYDVNIPDKEDNSTPLIIASKFGYTNIIKELLANGCTTDNVNAYGLNAIDIAVIRGNYDTCMLLVNSTDLKPEKTLENYKALNQTLNYPLFNMDLFYQCLSDRIPVEEVPSFAPERKRRKQFEGKVPDPNETWTNFAKRLYRLELYQPPLVDASSVQNKNSLYMRMQTTFCEMEYGIKMDLKDKKQEDDIESAREYAVDGKEREERAKLAKEIYIHKEPKTNISAPERNIIKETEDLFRKDKITSTEPEKLIMREVEKV